jgi:hypothetical protein
MAWLEKRAGFYRTAYRLDVRKLSCSLKTNKPVVAQAAFARFEDNLHRLELGILNVPDDADVTQFLLSDGKTPSLSKVPALRTMGPTLQGLS